MKTEKKKAQKALKKLREKTQKEEKRQQQMELEEKKKFASLSDREKVTSWTYVYLTLNLPVIPAMYRKMFLFF